MKDIPERIYELITLMLDGENTPEEKREFELWLEKDPAHEKLWRDYQNLREDAQTCRPVFLSDMEKVLVSIKQKTSLQRIYRKTLMWAAVFVLPLVVGMWLVSHFPPSEETHREFGMVSQPGGEKAVLRIADGKVVRLETGLDSVIIDGRGTVVRNDSNNILYYSADPHFKDKKVERHMLTVPRGGEYRLTLSDGTRVWLNSSTVLSYPTIFTGEKRQVYLEGEAYFEVAPDAAHPFIVSVSGMDIKVLGTSFNVSTYPDEGVLQTTLVEGRVEISAPQISCVLEPGQQATLEDGVIEVKEVDVNLYTSWIQGRFVFYNTTLEEISRQMARWYDTDIFFSSEQVKQIRFTGAFFRFEPLEELIRMIEATSDVRFSVKGKTIVISKI